VAARKRTRRTPEERIQELEAKIALVKARAEQKRVARNPALRHVRAALKAIDRALAATQDPATRRALGEASTTLAACLGLHGLKSSAPRMAAVREPDRWPKFEEDTVLRYIQEHPASCSEEIAAALGTDTTSLRAVLQRLQTEGKARSEGHGRAMRYFAETGS